MRYDHKTIALTLIAIAILYTEIIAQQLAFPGAEGFGKFTSGGRGGVVIKVTNLNDSGSGSLREAVEKDGARIIVFRISGNITLESNLEIKNDNITIAGQTAPGDGICVRGYPVIVNANNVIIRYLRFRLGDVNKIQDDAFSSIAGKKNIIVDHCSASWGIDECLSFYNNETSTVQWCIISESLDHSYHKKGDHGYGGIWGGKKVTFHHNLLAHNTSRNPRFCGSRYHKQPEKEIVDFVNNVIYNWGFKSSYGGEAGNHNIRFNYYKYGPATLDSLKERILEPFDSLGNFYLEGNFVFGSPKVTSDNWSGVEGGYTEIQKKKKFSAPFVVDEINMQTPEEAFNSVLLSAGASLPMRDAVDSRIIDEVKNGTARFGKIWKGGGTGIIDSQEDVGGWTELKSLPAQKDSDHDGMPDEWETKHNLNPDYDGDRAQISESGYTMIEEYINELVLNK
ncbi:MAG: pectate lyase [bacterium]